MYGSVKVREGAGCAHQGNASAQPDDLQRCGAGTLVLLQLWNQVSQRDIDEAAAGKGEEVREEARQVGHQPPADKPAQYGDRTGHGHLDQGRTPAAAVVG